METCPICGNVEPPHWTDEIELTDFVRERARNYIFPPKLFHPTFWHALDAWGATNNTFEEWQKKNLLS